MSSAKLAAILSRGRWVDYSWPFTKMVLLIKNTIQYFKQYFVEKKSSNTASGDGNKNNKKRTAGQV